MATTPRLLPENIATERPVVHPALDWRDNLLLMGVMLNDGGLGVITSDRQILSLGQLTWPICDRARYFSRSPVTETVARRFREGYGAHNSEENAYGLVSVPSQVAAYYQRFIIFPEPWWPDLLALWTLGTYLYPIFSAYPYLRISSPEPGCGKSLLGQIISNLSFNGELMVSPTEANIFRLAESERGTQVWDEVENEHEIERSRLQTMRGVLLNGYRAGATVPRQERGPRGQFSTVRYHVYVPRVLIGLSELPQVVQQRVIELRLRRRSQSERVEQYRPIERTSEEAGLREMCALYALSYCRKTAYFYGNSELSQRLEQHLGQAGRLSDDLLLPLIAVGTAPRDGDSRAEGIVLPLVRRLITEAAPILSHSWNETATTTPECLSLALRYLEQSGELEPAALAEMVGLSPVSLARQLAGYGIRSERSNGRRVYRVTASQIAELRTRYRIEEVERESLPTLAVVEPNSGQ